MANTPKALYRGTATVITSTVLYTVPASTKTIVTKIRVTNTTAADATFTMAFGGVVGYSAVKVPANSTYDIDTADTLEATQTITGGAGTASALTFTINGVEIN